jgi:hypothetical protein
VFQETLFAPEMTVRDNIFLGTDHLFCYGRRKGAELETSRRALSDLGLDGLDVDRPMWMLSLAERQLVTIARAIIRPWRLLPGFYYTGRDSPAYTDPVVQARIPAGRFGQPEDIVGSVVYLASRASDYVTGHELIVDGGWYAR